MRSLPSNSKRSARFFLILTNGIAITGSFILIDPLSNATVGAGMIREDADNQTSRCCARDSLLRMRPMAVSPNRSVENVTVIFLRSFA